VSCTLPRAQGSVVQSPGPSAALYASNPYYTCETNYYVSTTGSSKNSGTSKSAPWDITTASNTPVTAGTCINLATGVYSGSAVTLNIQYGGNAASTTGYVVWRCESMPFSFSGGALQGEGKGCVIRDTNASFYVVSINEGVSYVMFDGLEVDGNSFNSPGVCLDDENNTTSHHIWVMNSDLHGCGQGGVVWNYTEWLYAIHNVWHDNAGTNEVMGSGLSFYEAAGVSGYTPTAADNQWCSKTTGLCYHIVVEYNVGYHNYNPQSGSGNTDGEGIILDDWGWEQNSCPGTGICPYNGAALVMGNIMYDNGGAGIEAYSWLNTKTAKATIVNNTVYDNYWDTHNTGTWRGDLYISDAYNVDLINNIAYTVRGKSGVTADNGPVLAQGASVSPTDVTFGTNLSYPGGENDLQGSPYYVYLTTGTNHNLDGSNPNFVSVTAGKTANNFSLKSGSPAIGFGQTFDLWQQSGSIDAGACPSSLTVCP
jgi:hypothetical protein